MLEEIEQKLLAALHGARSVKQRKIYRRLKFTEVGGHFNPAAQAHGNPAAGAAHAGDLGNVQADANGVATLNVVRPGLTLQGATGVQNRALIIHAGQDDLASQPTGNSGDRIGCAIIR